MYQCVYMYYLMKYYFQEVCSDNKGACMEEVAFSAFPIPTSIYNEDTFPLQKSTFSLYPWAMGQ